MRAYILSLLGIAWLLAATVNSEEEDRPAEEEEVEEESEFEYVFGPLIDGRTLTQKKPKCERHTECDPLHFCHYETCTPRVAAELGRCPSHGGFPLCVPFNTTAPGVPSWLGVIGVHNVCASIENDGRGEGTTCGQLPWDQALPRTSPRRQLCRYHTHCDVSKHFCPEDVERSGLSWESTCKERWMVQLEACPNNPYPAKADKPGEYSQAPAHSLPFWAGSASDEPGVVRVIVHNGHFTMELCAKASQVIDQCATQDVPYGGVQHDSCPDADGVVKILEAAPMLEPKVKEHLHPGLLVDKWPKLAEIKEEPDGSPENPYSFWLPKDSHEFCCPGCGYWCCMVSMSAARLGELGWRRSLTKKNATMVLSEIRSSRVSPQNRVIQETTNTPDFALKSGLFLLSWMNFSQELDFKHRNDPPPKKRELMERVNSFYDTYPWLPRSYLLSDKVHRAVMRQALGCGGPNLEWVIKSNSHHGEGIQKPQTLDVIRRLVLAQKDNAKDCGEDSLAAKKPRKKDGKYVKKHEAVLQEWMRSAQIPLRARNNKVTTFQLMFRVFFATMWPYRPKGDLDAKLEIWYWPQTLQHLYAHNLSHYDPIYFLSGKALQDEILKHNVSEMKNMPDLVKWEQEVAWPQALEALRKNVEWSTELKHVYESETQGRYQLGGIDFIVTENWGVRILEISMDPLHETVPQIVPLHRTLAERGADLFLHIGGFKSPLNNREPHGAGPAPWKWDDPPEWQLLMRNSVEVRPGDPEDLPVDEEDESPDGESSEKNGYAQQVFKENPPEKIPLFEGEDDPDLYVGSDAKQPEVLVRSATPRVVTLRNFLTTEEFGAVRRLATQYRGESEEDFTGRHFEMPYFPGRNDVFRLPESLPNCTLDSCKVESVKTDLLSIRKMVKRFDKVFLGEDRRNKMGGTLRMRRYVEGQGHPPHVDTYNIEDGQLVISVMMVLRSAVKGGATRFAEIEDQPIMDVFTDTGAVTVWWSCDSTGESDKYSEHGGQPVEQGIKWTATYFLYTNAQEQVCSMPYWNDIFAKGAGYQGPLVLPEGHQEL